MSDRKTSAGVSRNEYPKFSEFLRGYLHQDAVEEYDSAEEAAEEFLADADSDEKNALQQEVRKLQHWSERQSITAQNSAMKELGGYWKFDDSSEFNAFLKALLGAHPKHHDDDEDEF